MQVISPSPPPIYMTWLPQKIQVKIWWKFSNKNYHWGPTLRKKIGQYFAQTYGRWALLISVCSQIIKGLLKFCNSYMVHSHIRLHLSRDDHPLFLHLPMDDHHFSFQIKFLKKKTLLLRADPLTPPISGPKD
jgi:hypothetical protein